MSATAITALKGIVSGIIGYTNSVTIGDYKILNSGITTAVIIKQMPIQSTHEQSQSYGTVMIVSTYDVEVYRKYISAEETYVAVLSDSETVYNELVRHTKANGAANVVKMEVAGIDEPNNIFNYDGKGPYFMRVTIRVNIWELVTVNFTA